MPPKRWGSPNSRRNTAICSTGQLIRKQRGADGRERYFRLDVGNAAVRKKVRAVETNNRLDRLFEDEAEIK